MDQTGWTILAVVLSVISSALLTWRLQRYRKSKQYPPEGSLIRGYIQFEKKGLRETLSTIFSWLKPSSKYQIIFLGAALIVIGQIAMRRSVVIDAWRPTIQMINEWLRIDVRFLGNVFVGMTSTLIGGLIFAIASINHPLIAESKLIPLEQTEKTKDQQQTPFSKSLKGMIGGILLLALLLFRAASYQLLYIDVILWIGSLILITSAFFRYDRNKGISLSPEISTGEAVIIFALLICGFLIGTYELQNVPNSLLGDEGNFFETARFISRGEYRGSVFGFGVYSYPVFSSFFQAGILKLFGADLWGWRFASVVPAVLTVIPLYLMGRDLFNRWVGVIASLAMISSPYLLSFSRLGYNNSQTILIVALCVYFFITGLKKGSLFYIYLAGVSAGFGFLTYTAGRLGIVILCGIFGYFLVSNLRKKKLRRFLLIGILCIAIGWMIIAVPHILHGRNVSTYDLYHKMIEGLFIQAGFTQGLFGEEVLFETHQPFYIDRYQLYYNPTIYGKVLLRGFLRTILAFQFDEHQNNHFLTSSLAGPFAVFFYVVGFYLVLTHFWKSNSFIIFFWFGSAVILLSTISTYPPRPAHLVPIIPAVSLIIGLGVYTFVDQLIGFLKDKQIAWKYLQSVLLLCLCGIIIIAGLHEYFVTSPSIYRPNLESIMSWAGLNNPEDTQFFYIYDQEKYSEWKPFLYRLRLTSPEFESFSVNEVKSNAVSWPEDAHFSIFLEENQAESIVPILRSQIDQPKLITFRNKEEQIIGRAVYKGTIKFSSFTPFFSALGSLLTSRVMWIVLPLIGLSLYLLFRLLPKEQVASLQRRIRGPKLTLQRADQKGAESVTAPLTPKSNGFELGLFTKWGAKNADHQIEVKFVVNHEREGKDSKDG